MTEVVDVPASLDSLFDQISPKFDQTEAADLIHDLKRLYPTKKDSFDQTDLYGALKQLYVLGAISDEGNQRFLELLAKKASKKDQILDLISGYKEASSPPKDDDFVGRDDDVKNILKLVTNPKPRVPGVNLFGDSGIGKTTLAKKVAKRLESYDSVFIDLREIKCLNTVYFNILQAIHLPSWDDNKKERIYNHLASSNRKTVIILDSIEQLLSKENQEEQETRADFLEFLKIIMCTEASKKGYLQVILTSTIQLNETALKSKLFTEYKVKPFSKDISKHFISKSIRGDFSDVQQDKVMYEIAQLCRDNPYLLQGAQQLIREGFATLTDVLRKITARVENKVPEEFACISALFEALQSDHLRQVAVKISLLRRPFSLSTAMKVSDLSSDYDLELYLEMLATHKIITVEDVNGKRKYDMHALFRDFVASHLVKENPVYEEHLRKGKKLFFEHFSGKLTKLANNLDKEFVNTYSKLEGNRANFELAIQLSEENKETFDLLLHTYDNNQFVLMGILFEVLKDEKERRELFGKWAEAAEEQEQWLASALMRCWQSIQGSDLEGTLNEEVLEKAKASMKKMQSTSPETLNEVNSLFFHCQGKIKWMKAKKLTPEKRTKNSKHGKKLLEEGIEHLKQSVELRKHLNEDTTLTARALNLIGNCYMELDDPLAAKMHYQQAMDIKVRLVGSEKHWEIPTYYNQMAEVHEMLGRKQEEKWYRQLFGLKKSAKEEYTKAVEWMEKAMALQEELGVSDTDHTAIFQRNLANILIGLEKYDMALEYAQKSFKIRNANLGKHPETIRILYMIGIIHEWRKDPKAALESYEEAFAMEESLSVDNHSAVRDDLCSRLEAMCKTLKKKDKLKKYEPRIKAMKQIKSYQSTKETAVQVLPTTEKLPDVPFPPDDIPVTLTEPGTADTEHFVQEDLPDIPVPPDDIPVTPSNPGTADTEHPVQSSPPDIPFPPDDIPVTLTEPGTADTEHFVQEDLPDIPVPPDDIPVTPSQPETADTEHPVQSSPPDIPFPPDDIPVTLIEPGTADTEHPVQVDLLDVPLPPDDIPVTPPEPETVDTEHPVQVDLADVPLPPDDIPVTPTESGTADTEHPVQVDLPDVPLPPDDIPLTLTESGTADTEHPVQVDLPDVPLSPDDIPVTLTEPGTADTKHPVQVDLLDVPLPQDDIPVTPPEPGTADTEHPVQVDLPDVPLPQDDIPVTPPEPGTADTEHPVQVDLPDVPLPPNDIPVTPPEPGTGETEHTVQEDQYFSTTGISPQHFTINPEGGMLDIPKIGIRFNIPPHTVEEATHVIYQDYTTETLPVTSPAGKGETVVSYIVGLEPSTIQLSEPIFVSMLHSGPGKRYGYETIVKAYNQDSETWEEPKVLDPRQENISAHCRGDYVGVQISKLTILAVVTRLITDRFQVAPKGCVARSSVCHDVTVEFPEGAVDKTVEGTMKVIPVDIDHWEKEKGYPLPILVLCIDGFEGITFQKQPTVKLPQPSPEKHSESKICVLCLEDSKTLDGRESQWKDITEEIRIEENKYWIQLHVTHFSWWFVQKLKDISQVTNISSVFEYLYPPPRSVCFAAFKISREDPLTSFKLGLLCVDNKSREGQSKLNPVTGEAMRLKDKAYVKIEGDYRQETDEEPVFLRFLGDEVCQKHVYICKRNGSDNINGCEMLNVSFHAENNQKNRLCSISHKAKDIPTKGTEESSDHRSDKLLDNFVKAMKDEEVKEVMSKMAEECKSFLKSMPPITVIVSEDKDHKEVMKLLDVSDDTTVTKEDDSLKGQACAAPQTAQSKKELGNSDEDKNEDESVFVRPTNMDEIPLDERPGQTDNVYKMTSYPRGLALIVNIEYFNVGPHHPMYGRLKHRVGSKKDEEDITLLFRHLGFIVETINRTQCASELLSELKRISTEYDFSASDCFVLFVMSHGADGSIYASDGKGIPTSFIVSPFWNSRCKSLAGKPKLFFFQACRGGTEDRGVPLSDGPEDLMKAASEYPIPATPEPYNADEVPETADILEFYACYTGYTSYRYSETGSPFVRIIVEVFRKKACRHHISELITKVKKRVSEDWHLGKKQMPHSNDTLTKHLYFWPGVEFDQQ